MGPHFYNQAIKDAKQVIDEKLISLEDDLYSLERPISHNRRE
jgi:uncharacterized protein (DUF2164 family)